MPAAFADYEPFVARWAVRSMTERRRLRAETTAAERSALYHALLPKLDAMLQYLNGFALVALPPEAERLFALVLSLAEIARSEEIYGATIEAEHAR